MYLDDISKEEFDKAYRTIRNGLTAACTVSQDKSTIILGGQPGAGKSTFYRMREGLENYIAINGDEYRRFHPHYGRIIKTDAEHFAERTQAFSGKVVESLIEDLGNSGYNMIIEGTLRSKEVPINTCEQLKDKGYKADLVVIACDAETSWKSTIERAEKQKASGISPRLVPIKTYDNTVRQVANNLSEIEKRKCFDSITVMDRNGHILNDSKSVDGKASEILSKKINVDNWEKRFSEYEKAFEQMKKTVLKTNKKERSNAFER